MLVSTHWCHLMITLPNRKKSALLFKILKETNGLLNRNWTTTPWILPFYELAVQVDHVQAKSGFEFLIKRANIKPIEEFTLQCRLISLTFERDREKGRTQYDKGLPLLQWTILEGDPAKIAMILLKEKEKLLAEKPIDPFQLLSFIEIGHPYMPPDEVERLFQMAISLPRFKDRKTYFLKALLVSLLIDSCEGVRNTRRMILSNRNYENYIVGGLLFLARKEAKLKRESVRDTLRFAEEQHEELKAELQQENLPLPSLFLGLCASAQREAKLGLPTAQETLSKAIALVDQAPPHVHDNLHHVIALVEAHLNSEASHTRTARIGDTDLRLHALLYLAQVLA